MKMNNEIAQAIIDEMDSSLPASVDMTEDALAALHNQDGTRGAQIAAECLQRIMPNITAAEHVQAASDVLRWYVDGDDLDYVPLEIVDSAIDYHAQRRRHMF
jgi:hypothetical protein